MYQADHSWCCLVCIAENVSILAQVAMGAWKQVLTGFMLVCGPWWSIFARVVNVYADPLLYSNAAVGDEEA